MLHQVQARRDTDGPLAIGQQHSDDAQAELAGSDGESEAGEALLPAPTFSEAELEQRCAGVAGTWCQDYLQQRPIVKKPPPRGDKDCLWGCNFVGVCDRLAGWCRCPAGWTGDDCSTRLKRPCSWDYRRHGFEPFNEPVDYSQPSGSPSRCSQLCDEDVGLCFCNSTMEYGRVPPDPSLPPGTPLVKRGRPMSQHCQPKRNPDTGEPAVFGTREPAELFGPEGWCRAAQPAMPDPCPCIVDGYCGRFCDQPCEPVCPNQCSGHGECLNGFCKCHKGHWGHDCAYRYPGTEWTPGLVKERPWIAEHVAAPAAEDPKPGDTRKRPLIYVYELPAIFNSKLLQYRPDKGCCTHRLFNEDNSTYFGDPWVYAAETGLHEALLQSEHRTLDPEEADYFYIPVYSSCYLWPLHGDNDFPFFHSFQHTPRVHGTINMLIEVHAWIRSHLPYWDRNGGRDHIILQTHDEGSCWLPAVLRPAILLAHWGRMDAHHISNTGYSPDNYTYEVQHPVYMPEGSKGKLGDFPCYDPSKDLIIPPMASPMKYPRSPLLGAPSRNRTILGFFKGRTQQNNPPYSRGIRQKLENLCRDNDWWGKHRIHLGDNMPEGLDLGYSDALASSTFCFALPGDGWSARLEDSIQHGCIPVIIQDNVHLAFESILDFPAFSLRIPQADMERVPDFLLAVPPARVAELQRGLAKVWRRFAYSGYKPYLAETLRHRKRYQEELANNPEGNQSEGPEALRPLQEYDPAQGDALETIFAWLHSRIPHTQGAAAEENSSASSSSSRGQTKGGRKAVRKRKHAAAQVE
ncbi:hypothetical protein ABPG77_004258 [Micractinium sp. CCAP 211/92]